MLSGTAGCILLGRQHEDFAINGRRNDENHSINGVDGIVRVVVYDV